MKKILVAAGLTCALGVGTALADSNNIGKTGFNVTAPKYTMDVKNADNSINSVIHITSGGDEHDGGFITSAGPDNGPMGGNSNLFLSTGAAFDSQGWKQEANDGKSAFFGAGPAGFRVYAQQNNIPRGTYLTDVQGNVIEGRVKRILRIGYDGLTTFNSGVQVAPEGGENDGGWLTSTGTKDGPTNFFLSNGASYDAATDKWIQRSPDGYSSFFGSGPAGFRIYMQRNAMFNETSNPLGQKILAPLNATNQVMKIDYDGVATFNGPIQIAPTGGDNDGGWLTSSPSNNIFLSSGASYDPASAQWLQRSTDGASALFGAGPSGFRVYMQQTTAQPLEPITIKQVMKIGYDGVTTLGGGLQLNSDSAIGQPACDGSSNKPGMIWYNNSGSDDVVQICAKVNGEYRWRTLNLQ